MGDYHREKPFFLHNDGKIASLFFFKHMYVYIHAHNWEMWLFFEKGGYLTPLLCFHFLLF